MMENFFACFENSTSKIRRIVLCCRRKPLTPPFPFLVSETSKFEARVLKSQSIRKLRSSGFCFGSWVALRPLVCSWSILGPISRNQSAHSRTEPKLLSSTASEDDQETPLKHSLWTKSLTWTHPAPTASAVRYHLPSIKDIPFEVQYILFTLQCLPNGSVLLVPSLENISPHYHVTLADCWSGCSGVTWSSSDLVIQSEHMRG